MKQIQLDATLFFSLTDVTVKRHEVRTFEQLVSYLSESVEATNKHDVELWSPTKYRSGTERGDAGVESVSCFVYDLDGVRWETVKHLLEPYEYFAHTTWSHSVEQERWRVVFPLSRPVLASEWKPVWGSFHSIFGQFGDPTCSNVSRFYYRSAHRPGHDYDAVHHEGQLLNPDSHTKTDAFTAHHEKKLNSVRVVLDSWNSDKHSGRHETALRCVLALERMRTRGATVDDTLNQIHREFVSMILDRCSPGEADKEWRDIVASARTKVSQTPPPDTKHSITSTDATPLKKQREPSVAEKLVQLGKSLYRFTVGDNGQPLAVPLTGSPIAKPLDGKTFKQELSALYHDDSGRVANGNAVNEAVATFSGFANRAEREEVFFRCADLGDRIVLDLGDTTGNVVEITAQGFNVLDVSPVVFRRSETLGVLARPTTPNLEHFRSLVPADDESFRMVVLWLVASHFDLPRPILFPQASQGAGKTTLVRWLKRLTDPSPAEVNPLPRDEKHWKTLATNSHVIVLDNVSRLEAWVSDAFCRAVTGDGAIERTLYSDNTPSVYSFKRALVLTSIHLASLRGDFTERLLPVTLQRIPDDERRPERELEATFQAHVGETTAELYRLTAGVLAQLHTVQLERPPRMADFARIATALDNVTGWDTFNTYTTRAKELVADVAYNDEVGRLIIGLASEITRSTTYTAQELLNVLREPARLPTMSNDFPRNAQQLGTRLAYLAVPLQQAGVVLEKGRRSARERRWILSPTSDGSDGCDGLSLLPSLHTSSETREAEKESA